MKLPLLVERGQLADLCREVANDQRVEPALVEKDLYLTRLLWGLGQELTDRVLLKGGTLLSKVDLGFFRLSEDADLVIHGEPSRSRGVNARRTNEVRDFLKRHAALIGLRFPFPSGESSEKSAHVLWELFYDSEFGEGRMLVETSIRPLLREPRRVKLEQLLTDPLAGDHEGAHCWALDADEARAEKVRAAFTREAIRDFYDLDRLAEAGADFTSRAFIKLVDAKLAELTLPPLAKQPGSFALTAQRRKKLVIKDLDAVLRRGAPPFALDAVLERFNRLWGRK